MSPTRTRVGCNEWRSNITGCSFNGGPRQFATYQILTEKEYGYSRLYLVIGKSRQYSFVPGAGVKILWIVLPVWHSLPTFLRTTFPHHKPIQPPKCQTVGSWGKRNENRSDESEVRTHLMAQRNGKRRGQVPPAALNGSKCSERFLYAYPKAFYLHDRTFKMADQMRLFRSSCVSITLTVWNRLPHVWISWTKV